MGFREDFMVVRRAAVHAEMAALSGQPALSSALAGVLKKVSANEFRFINLHKIGAQAEVIDLAYAVLGEERPDGPAVVAEGKPQ